MRIAQYFPAAVFSFGLVMAVPSAGTAQEAPDPGPAAITADSADVASVDAIIAAVYDVISGPAGQKRDWDRFRSLYIEGARLVPTGRNRQTGEAGHGLLTIEDYVSRAGPQLENGGFFEVEIARRTERYGSVVHAFSTYESRRNADDAEPFMRGINSFQLLHEKGRWWVVTIFWQPEYPDLPIPGMYLSTPDPHR
jgi:hypothetical protein